MSLAKDLALSADVTQMATTADDDISTHPALTKRSGRVVEYVLFLVLIAMFATAALNLFS